jgi:hypothetical protein
MRRKWTSSLHSAEQLRSLTHSLTHSLTPPTPLDSTPLHTPPLTTHSASLKDVRQPALMYVQAAGSTSRHSRKRSERARVWGVGCAVHHQFDLFRSFVRSYIFEFIVGSSRVRGT